MSNCPFCGTKKVSKTFNFNEYTCDLCECDYKHTSDGIRIFQEGSWAAFCNSITEEISSKAGAPVVDLISKTMRGYSKRDASEIDLVIESLSSIASTLNSEMKVGLRNKNDFLAVMEQIDTAVRAAHTLHKRQEDLGIRVKLSESVLEWYEGDGVEEGAMSNIDVSNTEEIDSISDDVVTTLGEAAAEDDAVIAYVQENHPDAIENLNAILQAVHDKLSGDEIEGDGMTDVEADADTLASAGMGTDEDYGSFGGGEYDESAEIAELKKVYPVDGSSNLLAPDLEIEPGDEADDGLDDETGEGDGIEVKLGEDEDPFAADAGGGDSGGGDAAPAEGGDAGGGEDPFAAGGDSGGGDAAPAEGGEGGDAGGGEGGGDEGGGEDPFAAGGDEGGGDGGAGEGADADAIADVQDAAETVQDKFKRLETKIDDLLSKVDTLGGGESTEAPAEGGDEGGDEGGEGGEDPFASEGGEEAPAEGEQPVEGGEADKAAGGEGGGGEGGGDAGGGTDDPFAESVIREAAKKKAKKIGVTTTRGDDTKASYQRKQSAAEAHKETEEDGEDRTDMNAEVREEDIPFTEGPKKQMDKNTDSDAPGATKKPTGKEACREGFNGFRVGDEVILEGSADTWSVLGIQKNIFTLGRGKTTTKIDVFKENVRHIDSRLEWQATSELMGESKNTWARVAANYVTESEQKVVGVVGLGGGNRIGGQKFGVREELSEATKIPVVETTAADRKDIYKYIKDNALHRCAREVAVQRVCERFTNPIEEIHTIVDDAVLSEDATQVESIDSLYEYKSAPIGEHALRQAFQKGWQSVVESETKEAKPAPKKVVKESRGVGYYRTEDDKLIDGLGKTAADRLMGR